MQNALRSWRSPKPDPTSLPEHHLLEANRNLRELLEDTSIPASIRQALEPEFMEIDALAEKLEREEIHIAAFGRVGAGKSSLLNALLGEEAFPTSPLHGETREDSPAAWTSFEAAHVVLIDTPGIDELDGQEREQLAVSVARRADILLMVCEGDLTSSEFNALRDLAGRQRPLIVVLNKSDRYTEDELELLLQRIRERCADLVPESHVLAAAADPRPQKAIHILPDGKERKLEQPRSVDVTALRRMLWTVLESEGKSLAALNAALFASELDRRIAQRIVAAREDVAENLIRKYCIGKCMAVAANPVPAADLLAAAGVDIAMVTHLGKVYGHALSRREASKLLLTIAAQLIALMGTYWGVNLVSSAMKGLSAGMSTVLSGTAQGALAWYATYVTGTAAKTWFARGKTWGPDGPRETVQNILDNLDRDSIMLEAREEISRLVNRPAS